MHQRSKDSSCVQSIGMVLYGCGLVSYPNEVFVLMVANILRGDCIFLGISDIKPWWHPTPIRQRRDASASQSQAGCHGISTQLSTTA